MKGLLLAGGHGTRLRPVTFTGNKHMIPIANEPMLFYGLRHLAEAGIRDVGLVLGGLHEGIEEAVGDGGLFGLRVTYIHQGPPKGLADAVLCAREFLGEDPFVMYLGDNLLQQGVRPLLALREAEPCDAVIGVTPVPHPSRYGVVELDGERIVSIVEKPPQPKSNLALIGVYVFSSAIHPIVAGLTPSSRGELEITDAIWRLHESGKKVRVQHVEGWWKDTGRPEDLLDANERILRSSPSGWFQCLGTVEAGAEVSGPVRIGPGARVAQSARVEGPAVIGARARIEAGAYIGPSTAVGDGAIIRGTTVRRSILLEGAEVEGPIEIVDSIIGRGAKIQVGHDSGTRLSCILGDATLIRF